MVSFLVIYATGEGQTAKVADRIVGVLEDRDHDASRIRGDEASTGFPIDDFDAVLVGTILPPVIPGVSALRYLSVLGRRDSE